MEIDMSKKIKKPIPRNKLHKLDDEMLDLLLRLNYGRLQIGDKKYNVKKCAKKIKNIHIIYGYRSALECLNKNGD